MLSASQHPNAGKGLPILFLFLGAVLAVGGGILYLSGSSELEARIGFSALIVGGIMLVVFTIGLLLALRTDRRLDRRKKKNA
jgi:hypothetical protein